MFTKLANKLEFRDMWLPTVLWKYKIFLSAILKMIATSGFLAALECTKFIFGQGSASDPAGALPQTP